MKIIWKDESREIPYIGILDPGKAYVVPDEIAESLIKQGQAKKYTTKKKRGE